MRHRKGFNHLGRTSSHRKAMLANMASSLILHKRIKTTTAKAKALRMYVEPLITKSKDDSTHSRRVVFSYLQDKNAVSELFREVSPKVAERPGGYTRILKIGNRLGDNAEMCFIELVDYNENMLEVKAAKPKTARRRRGGKKKTEGQAAVPEAKAKDEVTEEKVSEEISEEIASPATEEVKDKTPEETPVEEKKLEEESDKSVAKVKEEKKEEKKEE
jgi:large subunit ribosomal protein L17